MRRKLQRGKVEMELTNDMAEKLKDTFNCEIEMMQGVQEKMPDGRTRYIFKVDDQKGEEIKNFIIGAMFHKKEFSDN